MSLDIKIVQTAFNKKTLPLKVILGADFLYGAYDEGWRLHIGNKGDNDLVCYMPMQLARGIAVTWNEEELNMVALRSLTPTAPVELRALYDMVYRICTYWQCDLYVDDKIVDVEDFFENFDAVIAFNQKTLRDMARSVVNGENTELTLFSVKWPLVMGRNEAEAFLVEPSYFSKWMHDKQNVDAHHANPAFYRAPEGVIGRYAISEEISYILPIKPYVPYGFDDPDTGELIKCDDFGMLIYSMKQDNTIGELEYDDFIKRIKTNHPDKIKRYDGNHLIIEGLSEEELERLAE